MGTFKKAGIATQTEAQARLEQGEVFYHNGSKIKYDSGYIRRGYSPYRFGSDAVKDLWDRLDLWTSKCYWYDAIPDKGTLCWVRDSRDAAWFLATVTAKGHSEMYPWKVDFGTSYRFAEPASYESIADQMRHAV